MTDPDEVARAVAALGDVLDGLAVTWAVGGSIASAVYGEPRSTNDVDIVATLSEAQVRELVAKLGDDYYADLDAAVDAARRHGSFNVIDKRGFIKIDIFVPARGPLGAGQLDRRCELPVFPQARPISVLGPEDTVLQKLRWYRMGGEVSDRQWRDIVAVLRNRKGRLDEKYLDESAAGGDLTDLLSRARRDA